MGNQTRKRHGCGAGSKKYKRKVMQHGSNQHRTKDLDQIRTALKKTADLVADGKDAPGATFDPDLPGGGLFYCVETDRHFINQEALDKHKRTKAYKKRIRRLNGESFVEPTAPTTKENSHTHTCRGGQLHARGSGSGGRHSNRDVAARRPFASEAAKNRRVKDGVSSFSFGRACTNNLCCIFTLVFISASTPDRLRPPSTPAPSSRTASRNEA